MIFRKKNSTKQEEEEHSQEIIFLIPEFTVQVVFRQPRRVIANGALHLPLMSDFNECTRVPGRQGVAIIALKQLAGKQVEHCAAPTATEPTWLHTSVRGGSKDESKNHWSKRQCRVSSIIGPAGDMGTYY